MALFLQTLLGGLTAGSIYALVGLGVSMIFSVSRVLNLAQGEFVSLGALMTFTFHRWVGLPLAPAVVLAMICVAGAGVLFERWVIRTSRSQAMSVLLVITLGFSVLVKGVSMVIWGKDPMSLPSFTGDDPIAFGGLTIPPQTLWIFAAIVVISAFSWYFFERTLTGKALLAAAENRDAAEMIGIDVVLMRRLAFGLTALIGALAGALVAPTTFVSYDGGTMIGLKGFVAATVGGMGRLSGAVVGGLLLGLLEALSAGYINSMFKDVTAFIVLIVVLLVRSGLDKRSTLLQGA